MKNSALIVKPDSKDVTKVTTKSANSRFPIYSLRLLFLDSIPINFSCCWISKLPLPHSTEEEMKKKCLQPPHKIQISSTDNSIWAKKNEILSLYFFLQFFYVWMNDKKNFSAKIITLWRWKMIQWKWIRNKSRNPHESLWSLIFNILHLKVSEKKVI